MMLTVFFWVLMLLWIVLGPPWPNMPWAGTWYGHIILFLIILILGLHDFGNPLR